MRLIHINFRLGSAKAIAAATAMAAFAAGCGDDDGNPDYDADSGLTDDTTFDGGTTSDDTTTDTTTDGPDGGPLTDARMARSLVDTIADDPDLSTVHDLLVDTGLDEELEAAGPFTIFLPTNDAFELLPDGLLESLSNQEVTDLLNYHVISGAVMAEDIVDGSSVDTLHADAELRLNAGADGVFVNGLTQVTAADIEADNGVYHEVDSVLIPGPFPGTLIDALAAYPRLSALSAAIDGAGLGDALAEDDLTLFAPVNSAFEGVTLPENDEEAADVLTYHAWPANASAEDIVELTTARAVSGAFMVVETNDDGVAINDGTESSEVIYTDFQVMVSDGGAGATIHLLDRVLQPPADIATVLEAEGRSVLVDGLDNDVPGGTVSYGELLADGEAFTVFAPTDAAFSGFPLTYQREADLIGAHIVSGAVDSAWVGAAIADGSTLETLTGADDNELSLSAANDVVRINAMVQVTGVDIPASNGIIHLVDAVILPSDLVYPGDIVEVLGAYPVFSTLFGAVGNLSDTAILTALAGNADKTLFAPFNPAFEEVTLPAEPELVTVLGYHLLSGTAVDGNTVVTDFAAPGTVEMTLGGEALVDGSALTINGVNIIRTDIRAEDGIIHVLDEVLEPGAVTGTPDGGAPDSGMTDSGTPDSDAGASDAGQ